jgi:threonine/homoserine/homoserine lactone efflux protein
VCRPGIDHLVAGRECSGYRPAVPSSSHVVGFVAASVAILIVPGPSVLFVVARGVSLGRRAALVTMLGNETGSLVHVVAVAVGVGAVVARSVLVFNAVKLIGAAYLVYLGVGAIRHRQQLAAELRAPLGLSSRRLWRDGFVVGVTNPKTTLFFLAVLPQFVTPERGHISLQLLTLGVVFLVLAVVNDGLYGVAAGSVRRWLDRSPRRAEAVGGTSGLLMIGLGLRLALTGRHD